MRGCGSLADTGENGYVAALPHSKSCPGGSRASVVCIALLDFVTTMGHYKNFVLFHTSYKCKRNENEKICLHKNVYMILSSIIHNS